MNMNPDTKQRLMKLTAAAKAVIYEPNRMAAFLKMMGTKDGAVTAVNTVMAAIEQRTQVPPEVRPLLAVNIYMLMVDVAQEVMQRKPSPNILKEVVQMLLTQKPGQAQPPQAPQPPAPQPGLLAQGVA